MAEHWFGSKEKIRVVIVKNTPDKGAEVATCIATAFPAGTLVNSRTASANHDCGVYRSSATR
jgi:hypothetical protein